MYVPCYKCENRILGCHSNCKLYLEWKEDENKKKEEIDKIRNPVKEYDDYKKKVIERERRKYGRRK